MNKTASIIQTFDTRQSTTSAGTCRPDPGFHACCSTRLTDTICRTSGEHTILISKSREPPIGTATSGYGFGSTNRNYRTYWISMRCSSCCSRKPKPRNCWTIPRDSGIKQTRRRRAWKKSSASMPWTHSIFTYPDIWNIWRQWNSSYSCGCLGDGRTTGSETL